MFSAEPVSSRRQETTDLSVPRRLATWLCATLIVAQSSMALAQVERVQANETFTDEVTVFEVEVPVQVFRDGEPVRGLEASDFLIRYRGELQEIVSFEIADVAVERERAITGAESSAGDVVPVVANVAPELARSLLLLFDFEYQNRGLISRSVKSAREMIEGSLHPADRVAVAALGGRNGARLYTGFTDNRERTLLGLDLVDAVADAKGKRQREILAQLRATNPTSSEALAAEYGAAATVAFGDGLDSIGVFKPNISAQGEIAGADVFTSTQQDPDVAEVFAIGDTLASFNQYRDVAEYAEALGNLGTLLSGVEGQKLAVLFSQGPPLNLLNMGTGPSALEGSSMVANAMERAFGQLVRAGWQIHALGQGHRPDAGFNEALPIDYDISLASNQMTVDAVSGSTAPSGANVGNFAPGSNSLWFMAKGTGGKAYINANEPAVEQFLETTSVTYLLRFLLPGVSPDAAKERYQVSLADGIPPAQLQYRPFFYAPKAASDMNAVELAINEANDLIRRQSRVAKTRIEFTAHAFADLADAETAWLSVHLAQAQLSRLSNVDGALGSGDDSVRMAVVAGVEKGGPAGEVALDQTLTLTADSLRNPPPDGLTFVGRLDLSATDVATVDDILVAVELGSAGASMKIPLQRWGTEQRFDTGIVGPFFLPPGLERLIVRGEGRDGQPVQLPLRAAQGAELVPLPFSEVAQSEELGVLLWTSKEASNLPGSSTGKITVRAEPFQVPDTAASSRSSTLELERRGDVGELTLWFAPLPTDNLAPGVYRIVGVDFDNPGVGFFRVLGTRN